MRAIVDCSDCDEVISFIYITDKQYLMTENYLGKNFEENEESIREKNGQLLLF